MTQDFYSGSEFQEIKNRLNKEILRRGTFKWWDPLTKPAVGGDKSSPLSIPDTGDRKFVDEKTYTINTPSTGSIEPTRNINYEAQGDNPEGSYVKGVGPTSSAAQLSVDEMRNFIIGLAKINDINLFYGHDEIKNLMFRDPSGIEDLLDKAEADLLNVPLHESGLPHIVDDPNNGVLNYQVPDFPHYSSMAYAKEKNMYVMPSGEYDGEELTETGLGPQNFFDDYGANPGDAGFHPRNRAFIPYIQRDQKNQNKDRSEVTRKIRAGNTPTSIYGENPRNPVRGEPLPSRPVYGGTPGSCNNACTGLCYVTCDNECSEGCNTTCWGRCGNACTSSCGNVCTGCSSLCYTSCKTKCENHTGYSCVNNGSKAIKFEGVNGTHPVNNIHTTFHACEGCSFSCQFYPNKKTDCWDAGCMGKCFTTCNTGCSTSCYGGCVGNEPREGSSYRTGLGRGCQDNCTLNCIGRCEGTCVTNCVTTCWQTCQQECSDNCGMECSNECGAGCANKCSRACLGCTSCQGSCVGNNTNRGCMGCSMQSGCTSNCQHDCNTNCIGFGCRSICGSNTIGACESNCRFNCMNTACTAMCSDACASQCTTCVNTCDMNCGACTSECSVGCSKACNVTCVQTCEHSCETNCVTSCSEACGGCSNLCYSCVGICIGICSVRCESSCSSCAKNCGWWCDTQCNRTCFGNCVDYCINTCVGSCISLLQSDTKSKLSGPIRTPTSDGYIYKYPKNRYEERESFKVIRDIIRAKGLDMSKYKYIIDSDDERNIRIQGNYVAYDIKQSSINGGVYSINSETGAWEINIKMLRALPSSNEGNLDGGDGLFLVVIVTKEHIEKEDVYVKMPFGFKVHPFISVDNVLIIVIERDQFLLHGKVTE